MESDGDPEARIRELERTLAQQAEASELGTRPYEEITSAEVSTPTYVEEGYQPRNQPYQASQYEAPQYEAPQYQAPRYQPQHWAPPHGAQHGAPRYPTPQPPAFGSPYYAPPQHVVRKRQRALLLIPLVFFGVIMAGVVSLVAYFAAGDSDNPALTAPPTVPGESGTAGPAPTREPLLPNPEENPEIVTVEAGQSLNIGGVEQNRTVLCNQGSVGISGLNNTVDILGDCALVTVSGFKNVVTVQSAQNISASGFDNRVTYSAGTPEISNSGGNNIIEQG